MKHLELSFLSFCRTRPGTKTDAVPQPYNNAERLLKFRLKMLKLKAEQIRQTLHEGSTNTFGWRFKTKQHAAEAAG